MNKAYLKSSSAPGSDECLTPRYGVLPIVKHLKAKGYKRIWCPFDKRDSMFVRVLQSEGFIVAYTHIEGGWDFLTCRIPSRIDAIVSNPPFSIKNEILERLYGIQIPFAIILPQNSLQSIKRVDMYLEHGLEYLGFDRRLCYYTKGNLDHIPMGNHFASGYFCKDVLPLPMQFERLTPIQEGYYEHKFIS